ncbi:MULTISPECIES: nickel pincer cofactor-dependent isomerase, group 22 [Natrialbaceae]|uniref:lactate racemase domain-containing protein n=1 Tax=Natrialbaceae TaxID=1644061 RepID=UPI00207D5734|nr:lactate racemase domain-containing protein [Natronococcus sp. CG52]
MEFEFPDADVLRGANDHTLEELPRFATVERKRNLEQVGDVAAASKAAVDDIDAFESLPTGAEIAVTAGSRGVHDMPATLSAVIEELQDRGYDPFILPAMGSHGGATAEGQREMLEGLGVTPTVMGCEIRSSMETEEVDEDSLGRPVYASRDALEVDAILLVNRVKVHTDFNGPVESGLSKIAVVGLGKHRGAESLHNAAIATDFSDVIQDRMEILLSETPIVGGIALLENAADRAAHIEGINSSEIQEREPELLQIAREYFPKLPVDDLDMLIVDEAGKDKSGTGMDSNVLGRYQFHGEDEPESPNITRVYVRSLTDPSHGNGLGVGLADFVHRDFVADIDFEDMYVNIVTSGETNRAKLPFVVPDDLTALLLACSTTGVGEAEKLRVARIQSTMEPDSLVVSEPVANQLSARDDLTVGPLEPLSVEDGELVANPYDNV